MLNIFNMILIKIFVINYIDQMMVKMWSSLMIVNKIMERRMLLGIGDNMIINLIR